jgi:6-phosphofructokinase 1
VLVGAEGAGQELPGADRGRDASGNKKFGDIGLFLKARIEDYFTRTGGRISLKYIDPSYIIRSRPANTADALLCDLYARHAVHAAMAGYTDVMIGLRNDTFIHVPLAQVAAERKQLAPEGREWRSVLASTGQPPLHAPAPQPQA